MAISVKDLKLSIESFNHIHGTQLELKDGYVLENNNTSAFSRHLCAGTKEDILTFLNGMRTGIVLHNAAKRKE